MTPDGIPVETAGNIGLLLFLLAGVFAFADRSAVFLERWGPRVIGLRGIARRWARNTVEREERDEALAALAGQADRILDRLGENGKPLHDRVSEMQVAITGIHQRLEQGQAWMRSHEQLHEDERRRTA